MASVKLRCVIDVQGEKAAIRKSVGARLDSTNIANLIEYNRLKTFSNIYSNIFFSVKGSIR